jgi:hypothetical protein
MFIGSIISQAQEEKEKTKRKRRIFSQEFIVSDCRRPSRMKCI